MINSFRLLYEVVFDVFSLDSLRKTAFRTLLAGLYILLIEVLEEKHMMIDLHINYYVFYILGYVLVMLLYFKIGSSYYRWYDARKYWSYIGTRGKNLAQQLDIMLPKEDTESREWFLQMILNHAYLLKQNLRKEPDFEELYEAEPGMVEKIKNASDKPNFVMMLIYDRISELHKQGIITGYKFVTISRHFNQVMEFNEQTRGIRKVPSPASYTTHLRIFLNLFTLMLPFGFIHEHDWLIVFIMMIIYGAYEGCIVVSEEIEEPFGTDKFDLPMEDIIYSLKKHLHQGFKIPYGHSHDDHH